jgi:hypothetical protein
MLFTKFPELTGHLSFDFRFDKPGASAIAPEARAHSPMPMELWSLRYAIAKHPFGTKPAPQGCCCEGEVRHESGATYTDKMQNLTAVQVRVNMYGRRAAMQETKLTVRIPRDLLENAKRYAKENNTTLTALLEAYLRRVPTWLPLEHAPIVRRLSGILSQNVTVDDYKKHLEEKYA